MRRKPFCRVLLSSLAFQLFVFVPQAYGQVTVDESIVFVWTSKISLNQVSTIIKLFGDPNVYLPKLANNITDDLGVSFGHIEAIGLSTSFETLAFDYRRQLLYFEDSGDRRSLNFGASLYDSNNNSYYGFNPTQVSDQVRGMSADWISNVVYWVDGFYKRISVVSMNLALIWKPIIDSDLSSPQDVAVNPVTGHLFWSDAGSSPKIERSTLSGRDRTVLVSSSYLTSPSTLTIDFEGQRLFWLDRQRNAIGSVNFDGTNITVWTDAELSTASTIAMYKDFIFVGDSLLPKFTVYRVRSNRLTVYFRMPLKRLGGAIDSVFFAQSNQPDVSSVCKFGNGGCSHLCFSDPVLSRSCECSIGFVPGPDNVNCAIQPFTDEDYIFVADTLQRNIFQVRTGTGELRAILPLGDRFPTVVDFDFIHRYVYWIDNKTNAIGKVSLDGRLNGNIYQYASPLSHIAGLAIDLSKELLYFTDSSLGRIIRITTTGSDAKLVYSDRSSKPKSIAIDIATSQLYWSDCGSSLSRSIQRAKTSADDGIYDIEAIVIQDIGCPSIAIDSELEQLFWSDDLTGSVWKAKMDGSDRLLIHREPVVTPNAMTTIAVNANSIFISNSKLQWIKRIDRNTLNVSQQHPMTIFNSPGGVVTSHSSYRFPGNRTTSVSRTTLASTTTLNSKPTPVSMAGRLSADSTTKTTAKVVVDINHTLRPTTIPVQEVSLWSTPRVLSSTLAVSAVLKNDGAVEPVAKTHNAPLQIIDHTTVIVIAVVVGGVVLMTGMITLGVCVVAKRRRARADADHHYTMPDEHTMANYTTSTGNRSSNTYDFIPYATTTAVAAIESPDIGYLIPTANDDYLKPVDGGAVYYSIKDDSAIIATLYDVPPEAKPLI